MRVQMPQQRLVKRYRGQQVKIFKVRHKGKKFVLAWKEERVQKGSALLADPFFNCILCIYCVLSMSQQQWKGLDTEYGILLHHLYEQLVAQAYIMHACAQVSVWSGALSTSATPPPQADG